jgi:hypothetical protein
LRTLRRFSAFATSANTVTRRDAHVKERSARTFEARVRRQALAVAFVGQLDA